MVINLAYIKSQNEIFSNNIQEYDWKKLRKYIILMSAVHYDQVYDPKNTDLQMKLSHKILYSIVFIIYIIFLY